MPIPGLVSAIIPVYNRPGLLAEAVASVLAQTHRPVEIVIVDDGSTDDTARVAQELARGRPAEVLYARQANQGVSLARNAGLRLARGEFIQFLDSDDLLMPEKFRQQVAGLLDNPDCGISYCYTREYRLGQEKRDLPGRKTARSFRYLFPEILSGRLWPAPAPLFRRTLIDSIGLFHDLRIYEDWEYECRAAATGVELHHCREFLADKRDVHAQEGRRKGGTPDAKLLDYARVHELILGHARQAGVGQGDIDRFARKLFLVARKCAAAGHEAQARRCLELASEATLSPVASTHFRIYEAMSQALGWRAMGGTSEWIAGSAALRWARTAARAPSAFWALWSHRAGVARTAVSGRRIGEWPGLLLARWAARESRRKHPG
jgi:glycosyltransferase involved in cell wall biosynthesis